MSQAQRYSDLQDNDNDVYVEKATFTTTQGVSRGACFAVACVILFVAVVILIVIFVPMTVSTAQTNAQHIQTLDEKLAAWHTSDFETDGVYSLSRVYDTGLAATLALCHIDMYHMQDSVLVKPGDQGAISGSEFYGLNTRFTLQFNVPAQALSPDKRQRLDTNGEKYQLIQYEVATNYLDFSTVKLVDSLLDLHKKTLKVRREFIACTNNPNSEYRRCDYIHDDVLAFNNTRLLSMDTPQNEKKKQPKQNDTVTAPTAKTTVPKAPKNEPVENDNGIDLTPQLKENVKTLGSEISQLHVYHIQFYKANKVGRDGDFTESLVLTIKPRKC
jgi:hypothetical protein